MSGLLEQLSHLQVQLAHRFARALVTYCAVLARIRQHFGSVNGHCNPTYLEHPAPGRHLQHRRKAPTQQLLIATPQRADRVVVGMRVRA